MKEIGNAEKCLIPNVFVLCNLLIAYPGISCTPAHYSVTRHLKTWLRSIMTKRRFNSLGLLNVHKEPTDKLHLVEVGNKFIFLYEERFQYFGIFVKSGFTACVFYLLSTRDWA